MERDREAAWRARLLARRAESAAGDSAPVTLDQQSVGRLSRMDAMQMQAMAQETARRRRRELARIDAALALVEDGEFGWCAKCGEAIPEARLEIDPATPFCVDCAR